MAPTKRDIVVIGSLNMDLVATVPRFPGEGETLHAAGLFTNPGGKGGNQAVACARMGARVHMVGRVGDDAHGHALRRALEADGIDTMHVGTHPGPSGTAFVFVEPDGRNRIVIVAGANAAVDGADIDACDALFASQPMVVLQLEVPMATVVRAAAGAHARGCTVVLNPSPAPSRESPLPEAIWRNLDIVVLNEVEAWQLTGVVVGDADDAEQAARVLLARGPRLIVVTLGADGVVALGKAPPGDGVVEVHRVPARQVHAVVDTTAAGDAFTGALSAGLAEGRALGEALQRGVDAAGIAVTRRGAIASMPRAGEIDALGPHPSIVER